MDVLNIGFLRAAHDRFKYFYKRFDSLEKKSKDCNLALYRLIKEEIVLFENYIDDKAKSFGIIDQTPSKMQRDIEKLFEYNISVTNDISYNEIKISKVESMLSYYELKVSGIQSELLQRLKQYQDYFDDRLQELKKDK